MYTIVSGDFSKPGEFIRLWYVTNGDDLAFESYLADPGSSRFSSELAEADGIVESLIFPADSGRAEGAH